MGETQQGIINYSVQIIFWMMYTYIKIFIWIIFAISFVRWNFREPTKSFLYMEKKSMFHVHDQKPGVKNPLLACSNKFWSRKRDTLTMAKPIIIEDKEQAMEFFHGLDQGRYGMFKTNILNRWGWRKNVFCNVCIPLKNISSTSNYKQQRIRKIDDVKQDIQTRYSASKKYIGVVICYHLSLTVQKTRILIFTL